MRGKGAREPWWRRPSAIILASVAAICLLYFLVMPSRSGGLDVRELGDGDADAVVILLHGYGGGAGESLQLARTVQERLPDNVRFVVPEGPDDVGVSGHAWWNDEGTPPPGMLRSRSALSDVIDDCGVPAERVVVAGFSQGGMLAAEVALNHEPAIAGAVVLAGAPVPGGSGSSQLASHQSVEFLFVHSPEDGVTRAANTRRFAEVLQRAGLSVEYVSIGGPHGVPPAAVDALVAFVNRVFSP